MKRIIFSAMLFLILFSSVGCTKEPVKYTDWIITEKSYTPSIPAESGRWAYVFGKGYTYIFGTSGKPERYELKLRRESENGHEQIKFVLVQETEYNVYSIGDVYEEGDK